jgi:hypothetical protein
MFHKANDAYLGCCSPGYSSDPTCSLWWCSQIQQAKRMMARYAAEVQRRLQTRAHEEVRSFVIVTEAEAPSKTALAFARAHHIQVRLRRP